jgi:hypothetical protein
MFASAFGDWLAHAATVTMFTLAFWMWVVRKYAASNPDVKEVAKKAVAGKVKGIIAKWLG